MQDDEKTKEQLIDELKEMRSRVAEFESDKAKFLGTEKALREREQRIKIILSASPVGVVHTRNRRIIWANRSWEKMFGFENEQEYIAQHTSIMHPSEVQYENVRSMLYDNVKRGEVSETDAVLRRKDGSVFDAQISISLLGPEDPTRGTISAIADISERKATETALRESEEKYRLVVEKANDGIVVAQEGILRFINPCALEIMGYEAGELLSKPFTKFIHPDDKDMVLQYHFRRLRGEEFPNRYSFRIVRKDGETKWVEINSGMVDWEGNPAALFRITDITDRKLAEEALRESQERLELALKGADLGFWDLDLTTGQGVVNQRMVEMIGYSPGEVETSHDVWQQFIHPDDIGSVREHLNEHFQGYTHFLDHEYRIRTKSGQNVWVMARGRVVQRGEDGSPLRMAGTVMDITDRKRAEEALRHSQEMLSLALDGANLWIWDWDLTTGKALWSERNQRMLGYEPNDFEPNIKNWKKLVHPEDWPKVSENLNLHIEGKLPRFDVEYRIMNKHGDWQWVQVLGKTREFDAERKPIRITGVVSDITERKEAEGALRQSEGRLELAMKAANLGMWDLDLATGRCSTNERVFEMFGYTSEEVEPTVDSWQSSIHPDDSSRIREVFRLCLEGFTDFFELEYQVRTKSGEYVWILSRGKTVARDDSGRPSRLAGTFMDISERKQSEQEKENLRSQLLQSQKMETMGTLAAGIAHDFNNMLTIILGFSDMLLADKNIGDHGYEELQKIVKTSQDAADLVQKIRIFGRKAEMILVPLDLNHQIDQVTKLLSSTLPKMIEMDIHLTKDPVIIKADSSQIAQMVMNLAINANEAMPQGGRLSIQTENIVLDNDYCRLHVGVKPGQYVMLTVSDTGRGIDKGLMERIFDPFYSTKMRDYHKGTGLGLSVVQGIVQQHGGHITVESDVGKGTIFRMYFPALEHEIVPEYVETQIPYSAGGTETILLVEDMDLVRELGVIILEKFGYTVLPVADGLEALEVYQNEQENISLVILDIIMPRMDGKECLEQLLRINPNVKAIISSGVGQEDLINEVLKIGAKGAVNKPYGMRQLLGMVRDVLDRD